MSKRLSQAQGSKHHTRERFTLEHLEVRVLLAATPLTVITHGFQPNGSSDPFPPWVFDMATAINERLGSPCTEDQILHSRLERTAPITDPAGCDHFLLFDWRDRSNVEYPGAADETEVAGRLAAYITDRLPSVGTLDIHFIGHSRGAYVNIAAISRLGDDPRLGFLHMTSLDPQAILDDGALHVPSSVDIADNYFQTAGSFLPDEGKPIDGALNINLTKIVRWWGGRGPSNDDNIGNHSEVHDWYHWTIDKTDDNSPFLIDSELPTITPALRSQLYGQPWGNGAQTGYYYSTLRGLLPLVLNMDRQIDSAGDGSLDVAIATRNVNRFEMHVNGNLIYSLDASHVQSLAIYGSNDPEFLDASALNVGLTIDAGGGNDTLLGGAGNDSLSGGPGNDLVDTGFGSNPASGGPGFDTIRAVGSAFGETMIIGSAQPGFFFDFERAELYGNGGDDRLVIIAPVAGVEIFIDGGPGNDTLDIRGSLGSGTLLGGDGDDALFGGSGDDVLDLGFGANSAFGGPGFDIVRTVDDNLSHILSLNLAAGTDLERAELYGNGGNDTLRITAPAGVQIFIDGGDGNDFLDMGASQGSGTLKGSNGNDTLVGGSAADALFGDAGGDWLFGQAGDDLLRGGDGNDYLDADGGNDAIEGEAGADTLLGGSGNDRLDGGTGSDNLDGGSGNDTLYGGRDTDTDSLTGGSGADVFTKLTEDVVIDFKAFEGDIIGRPPRA